MSNQKPVICLMGPTASGKTDFAIQLVNHYPLDIISVDSTYVYKGLEIGSAKPTAKEREKAPHRLIDICEPNENYSVGRFLEDVNREIADIYAKQKIPLLVGGTLLYFYILQNGMADLPSSHPELREKIEEEAEKKGWKALHQQLMSIDPSLQQHIHANDKQRIQRALELYYLTDQKPSELQAQIRMNPHYSFHNIIIAPDDRKLLHERIAVRFNLMLENGLIDEVKNLRARGDLNLTMPSMRAVGYRQVWQYLDGDFDYDTMRNKSLAATRQLAKRQFTWLRRWPNALRLITGNSDLLDQFEVKIWRDIE